MENPYAPNNWHVSELQLKICFGPIPSRTKKAFSLLCLSGILPQKSPLDKAETRLVKGDMEVTRKSFLFSQYRLNSLSCGHTHNSICEKELYRDAELTGLYYNTMSFSVVILNHSFIRPGDKFDFQLNCFPLEYILIRL